MGNHVVLPIGVEAPSLLRPLHHWHLIEAVTTLHSGTTQGGPRLVVVSGPVRPREGRLLRRASGPPSERVRTAAVTVRSHLLVRLPREVDSGSRLRVPMDTLLRPPGEGRRGLRTGEARRLRRSFPAKSRPQEPNGESRRKTDGTSRTKVAAARASPERERQSREERNRRRRRRCCTKRPTRSS